MLRHSQYGTLKNQEQRVKTAWTNNKMDQQLKDQQRQTRQEQVINRSG